MSDQKVTIPQSSSVNTDGGIVEVGKLYDYTEDGYAFEVKVLEIKSDEDMHKFRIKITDMPASKSCPLQIGNEFDYGFSKTFNGAYNGMARLWNRGEYFWRGRPTDNLDGQSDSC